MGVDRKQNFCKYDNFTLDYSLCGFVIKLPFCGLAPFDAWLLVDTGKYTSKLCSYQLTRHEN